MNVKPVMSRLLLAVVLLGAGCGSGTPNKGQNMETTIKCGKQVAEHADIAGSEFRDVNMAGSKFENANMAGAKFDNVNLSKASFFNINLSDITITAAQIGGAKFKHVGPPPDKDGKQERQRAVSFEEMMLCDSTFVKVDLSNVRISDCDMAGMTIDGIPVADMIAAYKQQKK